MVYINDQKYACESCIKGHRSSSCQHADRPLFEIKKKGRPVSQCEKCRELRKTKRMHNKCNCSALYSSTATSHPIVGESSTKPMSKSRRFKPIAPALPHGIRGLTNGQDFVNIAGSEMTVEDTTTGICPCKNTLGCQCESSDQAAENVFTSTPQPSIQQGNGLAALAEAAAFCCSQAVPETINQQVSPSASDKARRRRKQPLDSVSGRSSPQLEAFQHKRLKSVTANPETPNSPAKSHNCIPELPPLLYMGGDPSASPSLGRPPLPVFPPIPPLSEIASLAGSGCVCGVQCACPGCVEHRGEEHASEDFDDCDDACGTCVDYEGGFELPSSASRSISGSGSGEAPRTTFIDDFFARAASLPRPPSRRKTSLDATNITVYPPTLFVGALKEREERSAAFGLVSLPPLRCGCAGGCGCPEGQCGCGDGCSGCSEADKQEEVVVRR